MKSEFFIMHGLLLFLIVFLPYIDCDDTKEHYCSKLSSVQDKDIKTYVQHYQDLNKFVTDVEVTYKQDEKFNDLKPYQVENVEILNYESLKVFFESDDISEIVKNLQNIYDLFKRSVNEYIKKQLEIQKAGENIKISGIQENRKKKTFCFNKVFARKKNRLAAKQKKQDDELFEKCVNALDVQRKNRNEDDDVKNIVDMLFVHKVQKFLGEQLKELDRCIGESSSMKIKIKISNIIRKIKQKVNISDEYKVRPHLFASLDNWKKLYPSVGAFDVEETAQKLLEWKLDVNVCMLLWQNENICDQS